MREGGPVACIDETIATYLGRADVATALHVVPTLHWSVCGSNSSFNYHRTELDERMDVYPTIYGAGVRVLIYNGEADACVPWLDNANWVSSMNFSVSKPWTSWESLDQNAGYITAYTTPSGSDFGFATVKGAGVSFEQSVIQCAHPPQTPRSPQTPTTRCSLLPSLNLGSIWFLNIDPHRLGQCSPSSSTISLWRKKFACPQYPN